MTVTELRKSGNLDEALKLGYENLNLALTEGNKVPIEYVSINSMSDIAYPILPSTEINEPEGFSIRKAKSDLGWVFFSLVKDCIENKKSKLMELVYNFFKIDLKINSEYDTSIYSNILNKLGFYTMDLIKSSPNSCQAKVYNVFKFITNSGLKLTQFNKEYNFLMRQFVVGLKDDKRILEVIDSFSDDSFDEFSKTPKVLEGGRTLMSFHEEFYIKYAKAVLLFCDNMESSDLERYITRIENTSNESPKFIWLPFFLSKIYLAKDGSIENLDRFLSFAKKKKSEFWIWMALGEFLNADSDKKLACYIKAASLPGPENMKVNLRSTLSDLLVHAKLFNEAKFELNLSIQTRKENDWAVKADLLARTNTDWYKNAKTLADNNSIYNQYKSSAEKVLFGDLPTRKIVVTNVNREKHIMYFMLDNNQEGYCKFKGLIKHIITGNVYNVKFEELTSNEKPSCAVSIELAKDDEFRSKFVMSFESQVDIPKDKDFGFINREVFLNPAIIKKYSVIHGDLLQLEAVKSFNKIKNKMTWNVIENSIQKK
jgi:hypothetical protein